MCLERASRDVISRQPEVMRRDSSSDVVRCVLHELNAPSRREMLEDDLQSREAFAKPGEVCSEEFLFAVLMVNPWLLPVDRQDHPQPFHSPEYPLAGSEVGHAVIAVGCASLGIDLPYASAGDRRRRDDLRSRVVSDLDRHDR